MSASENALLAKVRAMYARRLTPEQLTEMLACTSSGEVAAYLKDKTPYGRYMTTMDPNTVHRGRLEDRLREVQSFHLANVTRFAHGLSSPLTFAYLVDWEVDRLERTLSAAADRFRHELSAEPPFFEKHSSVDWPAVEQAENSAGWARALTGSAYENVVRSLPQAAGSTDMTALDRALRQYRMNRMLEMAKKIDRGEERRAVAELVRLRVDLDNLVILYRLAVLRRQPTAAVAATLEGGFLTEEQLRALSGAQNLRQMEEVLRRTRLRGLKLQGADYMELAIDRYWFSLCEHRLRCTIFPSEGLLCYGALRRLELKNVLHLIEGVRYGAAQAAAGMLIGMDKGGEQSLGN